MAGKISNVSQAASLTRRGALTSAVALSVLPRSLPALARGGVATKVVPLADLPMQRYASYSPSSACCSTESAQSAVISQCATISLVAVATHALDALTYTS